jgi:hypothetical protein
MRHDEFGFPVNRKIRVLRAEFRVVKFVVKFFAADKSENFITLDRFNFHVAD